MPIRSRSARYAALALAVATPLSAATVTSAFAVSTVAEVSITLPMEPGVVEVHSTKGLSRTTVVLCDGSLVVIPSWPGDVTDGVVEVSGPVRAVFIHSGNNTTDAAKTLLESLAPGAVNGESTGAIAYDKACTTENPGGTGGGGTGGGGTGGGGTGGGGTGGGGTGGEATNISDPGPVTTTGAPSTSPAPSVTVLGESLVKADDPAPAPAAAPASSPVPVPVPVPVVDSNTLSAGGELPRTGSSARFLVTLALSLLASGVALRAAFGRRVRSASFPG